jgi:hypothetical protein
MLASGKVDAARTRLEGIVRVAPEHALACNDLAFLLVGDDEQLDRRSISRRVRACSSRAAPRSTHSDGCASGAANSSSSVRRLVDEIGSSDWSAPASVDG